VSDSAEGWCAVDNLGAFRVLICMGDRTDGQRMDDETDDGTHGFRGGFISHPDVLYYIGFSLGFRDYSVESPNTMLAI